MKNLLPMLRTDFTRAFRSSGFVFGVVSTIAIFFFGSVGMVSHNTSAVAAFNNTFKYNNISNLFFLTATFAYSASFCADWQTRFVVPLIVRSERTAYALSKCIATAVVGGLTVAIGAAIFMIYICATQTEMLPGTAQIEAEFARQAFGDLLVAGRADFYFLSYLTVIYLQGGFFSTLGLLLTGYLPNKYVAYIAPFTLSFLFNQIANLFRFPIWLDPVKMATARISGVPASTILLMAAATFLSLAVLCAVLFIRTAKRRIHNA